MFEDEMKCPPRRYLLPKEDHVNKYEMIYDRRAPSEDNRYIGYNRNSIISMRSLKNWSFINMVKIFIVKNLIYI